MSVINLLLLLFLSWSCRPVVAGARYKRFPIPGRGICKDVVEKYNYPCEEHNVTTEDGYTLSIQRIPRGHDEVSGNGLHSKAPILLQHGLFMDAASFMLIGRDSLVFNLADKGFDVWVANSRGTRYSRHHRRLKPGQKKFWDWTVDDLVKYDFPATVNYVYEKTWTELHYLGHSMGAMIAVKAMSSDDVAGRDRIRSVSLTSPIVYMNHVLSPFTELGAHLFIPETRAIFGVAEYNILERPAAELARLICGLPLVNCSPFFLAVTGPNCCLNQTGIMNFLEYETQSTSNKLLIQLAQNVRGGGLRKFDYGSEKKNKKHYGKASPPEYDVKNIPKHIPMFFCFGGLDFESDLLDVQMLLLNFWDHDNKKIVKSFVSSYAHGDFLMGTNIGEMVHKPLISFLKSH